MCISVHQLCYVHADKEPLFQDINLTVNKGQRLALVVITTSFVSSP